MVQPSLPASSPTFEELYKRICALPENLTGEILEPGVLGTKRRPGSAHRQAHAALMHNLADFNRALRRGGGDWWIDREADILFPQGRLLVPDLFAYRVARVPKVPDENPLTVLPDWVCEILTPTTATVDRLTKLMLYARSGVPWVWIVDPELRILQVFETIDSRAVLTVGVSDEDRATLPPFGDLDMTGIWLSDGESMST